MKTHGGARAGAGRKTNEVKRNKHLISFTDEDWEFIKNASGSQRKIADFIVKAVREYVKNGDNQPC